jgi:hypothetical protein
LNVIRRETPPKHGLEFIGRLRSKLVEDLVSELVRQTKEVACSSITLGGDTSGIGTGAEWCIPVGVADGKIRGMSDGHVKV